MIQDSKLPLHSEDMEMSVIGGVFAEPHTLQNITPIIRPECFYSKIDAEIFRAMLSLDSKRAPIDMFTVVEELKRQRTSLGTTLSYEVSRRTRVSSAANIQAHAMIVYQFFVLREMSKVGMKVYNLCHEPNADALDILHVFQKDLSTIDYIGKNNIRKLGDVVGDVLSENRKVLEQGGKAGITTGLYNVDKYHVKQKQEFGIIAARPGMGKTAYMLENAKHTATVLQKPVMIFSLEMSTEKLVGRIMASESGISSKDINQKTLNAGQLMSLGSGVTRLLDAPLYFDDTPGLDITVLRSKIRKMVVEHQIEEVYIDYLQLMAGEKKGNREQEISFISRNIKMIAKEENINITALAQLSRAVEARPDKKPMLSDLRESGSIEQDADWVFFLFRPEYYGLEDEHSKEYMGDTFEGKHLPAHNLLVLDCAKYREGSLFMAPLLFYGEIMKVDNYDLKGPVPEKLTPIQNNDDFLNQNSKGIV